MSISSRVTLPVDVTPTHYSLELSPNLETLDFTCNEVIVVDVVNSVAEITLHSKEISVDSVTFARADSSPVPSVIEINHNVKANTVKFIFDGPLPVGKGELVIKYKGILNGDMAGFYKSSYSDANGNKKVMASTQFEALDARRYLVVCNIYFHWSIFVFLTFFSSHHTPELFPVGTSLQ